MSTLTKVLVVLILLASGVSLGVVSTLYAYRTDYKTALRNEQTARKAEVASKDKDIQGLQADAALRESQAGALRQTVEKLRTDLSGAETAAKDWQEKYGTMMTEVSKLTETTKSIAQQIGEKDKVIEELTTHLQTAREELAAAASAKDAAEQHALDLQSRLAQAEKNLIELEKAYVTAVKGQ